MKLLSHAAKAIVHRWKRLERRIESYCSYTKIVTMEELSDGKKWNIPARVRRSGILAQEYITDNEDCSWRVLDKDVRDENTGAIIHAVYVEGPYRRDV